jgi:hypothetical protein
LSCAADRHATSPIPLFTLYSQTKPVPDPSPQTNSPQCCPPPANRQHRHKESLTQLHSAMMHVQNPFCTPCPSQQDKVGSRGKASMPIYCRALRLASDSMLCSQAEWHKHANAPLCLSGNCLLHKCSTVACNHLQTHVTFKCLVSSLTPCAKHIYT